MAGYKSNPTFGLPSNTLPISQPNNVGPNETWFQFFVRIAQLSAEQPIATPTVGASPFVYTASTIGHVFVTGGTVSSVVLIRSGISVTCAENIFIPVTANDAVTVTYSVAPTMNFIPSARA